MSSEDASTLEHLAELDRLLREVQVELAPELEPAPALEGAPTTPPTSPPPATPPATPTPAPPSPSSDAQLQTVSQLTARLLASMRELLDGYEQVLVRPAAPSSAPPQPTRHRDPAVTVTAGPFPSLDALHDFEQAVSGLAGVRDVAVRGYEGSDRAIIEVRLGQGGP